MNNELNRATPGGYRETRMTLMIAADRLTRQIDLSGSAPGGTAAEWERQRKLVIEMIADCSYIIEWLELGRMPGHRRGIERRAGYQREVPTDPALLGAVAEAGSGRERQEDAAGSVPIVRLALERALRGLTERERDCFRLSQAEGFALNEVADMLGITKSSVGTYLLRARRKIDANLRGGENTTAG